ncbi:hypothetical protein [Lysobacter enzymogenes]|uniref:hypothetical protein n=1 Tax=Lysobacter enzymogenes TaxID=69 RepID=UPI001AF76255|nr:hypothetical protein [Lysobacter enzymogenes]QQQ00886.1 hypothetical protein JHW41_22940 [Lysobacter enzymogenes]
MEFWKNVVIPILSVVIPIVGVWLAGRPSFRQSRQKKWLELLESGAWKTVHPMVLSHAARDYYGKQSIPSPDTIKFALLRSQDGDRVMRLAMNAGALVRREGGIFLDNRRGPKNRSSFLVWSVLNLIVGVSGYACAIACAVWAPTAIDTILSFLVGVVVLIATLAATFSMLSAHHLVNLENEAAPYSEEVARVEYASANDEEVAGAPVVSIALRD